MSERLADTKLPDIQTGSELYRTEACKEPHSVELWKHHVNNWSCLGPPLRPSVEDIAFVNGAVAEWIQHTGRNDPALLVLGVTPEFCKLPLSAGSRVIAVDKSPNMIETIWPGQIRKDDRAICSNWCQIPLPAGTIDLVLADGSLTPLSYPSGYSDTFAELRRLLRRGGRCIIRCFAQVSRRETPDDVFEDLSRGRIGNFHVFKWRLAMALQSDAKTGVAVWRVWNAVNDAWKDLNVLADRHGWPIAEVCTIEAYRNVDLRYNFPTADQLRESFLASGFTVVSMAVPSYELGERCPTFVLGSAHAAEPRS